MYQEEDLFDLFYTVSCALRQNVGGIFLVCSSSLSERKCILQDLYSIVQTSKYKGATYKYIDCACHIEEIAADPWDVLFVNMDDDFFFERYLQSYAEKMARECNKIIFVSVNEDFDSPVTGPHDWFVLTESDEEHDQQQPHIMGYPCDSSGNVMNIQGAPEYKRCYGFNGFKSKGCETFQCRCKHGDCMNYQCENFSSQILCSDECCNPGCRNTYQHINKYPPLFVYKTEHHGWGVACADELQQDCFVCEIQGRVVTRARFERKRMQHQPCLLLMKVGNMCIDMESISNMCRFFNHSCRPNCEAIKFIDGDALRVFLKTIHDIAPYEELTWNYGTDLPFECTCDHHPLTSSQKVSSATIVSL
jgi:histone-lysine N-methyltransferase SETD2